MQHLLKSLPKVDTLLAHNELKMFQKSTLLPIIQSHLSLLRENISSNTFSPKELESALNEIIPAIKEKVIKATNPTLTRVINATGVVIHTNLGRSVFSSEILDEITPFLKSYHTLEYDLAKGKRSERYTHTTQILCEMFGCEDALLVNNNAAAVFLILNTFAKNKEVIISRGELVEIGGSFRIPEVMKSASSILCEVGATNKTHLRDYENAINEQSAMIMKVHQSNFKQIGFVKQCLIKEIIHLARKHQLIDYFDLGSGHIGALPLADEPSVREICKYKPSLLSFSGDKLLGAGQVGIIIGKSQLIAQLKNNQLLRALRVDKFSILALQATLKAYQHKEYHKIPTLAMLNSSPKELESKAQNLAERIQRSPIAKKIDIKVLPLHSLAGGGSLPHLSFDSFGLSLQAKYLQTRDFESSLRNLGLITCLQGERILLDMRTLLAGDEERIVEILLQVLSQKDDTLPSSH